MTTTKFFNYFAGVVALVHAGVTSHLMQQIYALPELPTELKTYEEIMNWGNSLPEVYFIAIGLFFLTGVFLFILAIVTLVLNWRLPEQLPIKRLALATAGGSIIGVFLSIIPLINILYPILLSICYIIVGYFVPAKNQ